MRRSPLLLVIAVAALALVLAAPVLGGMLARGGADATGGLSDAATATGSADRGSAADEDQPKESPRLPASAVPVSTSRAQWKQGAMPHLYQIDPTWAELPYAGGTIRQNACGPSSLAMVYVYLTGRTDMGIPEMAAFADANNYAPTGATEWAFMTQGAAQLGLSSTQIVLTRGTFTQALAAGQPIICSMVPGDFTSTGHYIVLSGIDDTGMVTVFDPNSSLTSAQRWPIQRILLQAKAAWAFSA